MAKKKKRETKRGRTRGGPDITQEITRVKFPTRQMGEMFGRIVEIFGNDRMQVFCEDGKHRVGRIRRKIKKRVWVRRGDLVVINPWEFETEIKDKLGNCEITWRYTSAEISWLERNKKVPSILSIDNIMF